MPRYLRLPTAVVSVIVVIALWLTWHNLNLLLPRLFWEQAWDAPDTSQIGQMLFQQVLRNPLAEPTTLGVATGAQLGIAVTTLWALPGGYIVSQGAALAGACAVGLLVFGVEWGKRLSPVTLILAGLVASLYCGAIN